jgi:hypothetical protein
MGGLLPTLHGFVVVLSCGVEIVAGCSGGAARTSVSPSGHGCDLVRRRQRLSRGVATPAFDQASRGHLARVRAARRDQCRRTTGDRDTTVGCHAASAAGRTTTRSAASTRRAAAGTRCTAGPRCAGGGRYAAAPDAPAVPDAPPAPAPPPPDVPHEAKRNSPTGASNRLLRIRPLDTPPIALIITERGALDRAGGGGHGSLGDEPKTFLCGSDGRIHPKLPRLWHLEEHCRNSVVVPSSLGWETAWLRVRPGWHARAPGARLLAQAIGEGLGRFGERAPRDRRRDVRGPPCGGGVV